MGADDPYDDIGHDATDAAGMGADDAHGDAKGSKHLGNKRVELFSA